MSFLRKTGAPADLVYRAAAEGMVFATPAEIRRAAAGRICPQVLLLGGSAESWSDLHMDLVEEGFRLLLGSKDFPHVVHLCTTSGTGRWLTATWCDGEVSIAEFDTYLAACAWIDADPASYATQFAFS